MDNRFTQFFLSLLLTAFCLSSATESYGTNLAARASDNGIKEIAFVDAGVQNIDSLIRGIDPHISVVVIDSQRDGVEQIAEALSIRKDISGVHILSHGRSGVLDLGSTQLSAASMQSNHADEMAVIRGALSKNADIHIYGCNFAQDAFGENAIDVLVSATGADVEASVNLTGAVALGGDWDMEVQSGVIETAQISVESWNGVLANEIVIDTTEQPVTSGSGDTATATWVAAGVFDPLGVNTTIDVRASVVSNTGTTVVFSTSGDDLKVRTQSTAETTILWEVFETGTTNPVGGDATFLISDIDGLNGGPLETVAALVAELDSYSVADPTNLSVSKVNGTIQAAGVVDAPNNQASTLEEAWISYSWVGASSWNITYKSEVSSNHDYKHDGNGGLTFTNPYVGNPALPVVFITSSLIANASNSSSYAVSGTCTDGVGNVAVAITGAGTPPSGQAVACTGAVWSTIFDVSLITDGVDALTINASQTDGTTVNAPTVQVNKDTTLPVITLVGNDPVNIELGTAYSDAGATASDNIDGDIS
ncbi:MAG: DUF4347 domain-containing protein, partial [Gammaproteobacteria bacterium]|nr:DUF4347 domain-containing protein [Gammaproteobacteria bacterium]